MNPLLVLGPLSKDINTYKDNRNVSIGGAVYFESFVFNSFNFDYLSIITLSKDDENLLSEFPNIVNIKPLYKWETLSFENEYLDLNTSKRIQTSNFADIPILKEDLLTLNISYYGGLVLNPLVNTDIPLKTIEYLYTLNMPIYLSLQGLLRQKSEDFKVTTSSSKDIIPILKYIDTLFLDEKEAILLYPELSLDDTIKKLSDYGPNEVIITKAEKGSIVYSREENRIHSFNSYKPLKIVSPTGCGDTYMAAYLYKRLNNSSIEESGKFASMVATIKLENNGPFNQSLEYVKERLNQEL